MKRTETVIIGAGQAGLALSHCLNDAGRDHVVFERGRLAERWRSERWDSLRLLTPNWMTRLPGWTYRGPDPNGFMTVPELVAYFEAYAASFHAPVQDETIVTAVRQTDDGYLVETNQGPWTAANVVIATGVEGKPYVPCDATRLPASVHQLGATRYRNPSSIAPGGVLVVGASASGVQLADELASAGREVLLSVGSHSRVPRQYRGLDVFWWLEQSGLFDTTVDEISNPEAGARAPSLQLVGRPSRENIDLGTLQARGVQLAGRLEYVDGSYVVFRDDLPASLAAADERMRRTLQRFDTHARSTGLSAELDPPDAPAPIEVPRSPSTINLAERGIETVIWATGFRRSYPWLHVPVLDPNGEVVQRRGVTPADGLYVLGLRFQHHRNSNFIDGVGRDAAFVAEHIGTRTRSTAEVAA